MAVDAKLKWDLGEAHLRKMSKLMREFGDDVGLSQKEVDQLEDELRDLDKKGSKHVKNVKNEMGGMNEMGKKLGATLAAMFAIDKLIEYQKKIIDIQVQYQKMEAVLTTALGSNSSAQIAMAQIANFASRTPFQINQLTESYVKLANRGLQPANSELTAMGDFAAASGKDMEQLVEAILDVNNTERWTELGLKVRTEGNRIKATFRGIEVEAERTERGALNMIKAFGEMEGVAGSMAGISDTLGGKISNMGDSFERLFKIIGNAENGAFMTITQLLTDLSDAISDTLEQDTEKIVRAAAEMFDNMREEMGETMKTTGDYSKKIEELNARYKELDTTFEDLNAETITYENAVQRLESKIIRNDGAIKAYNQGIAENEEKMREASIEMRAIEALIQFLTKSMKDLENQNKKTTLTWDDFTITVTNNEAAMMDAIRNRAEMLATMKEANDDMQKSTEDLQTEIDKLVEEGIKELDEASEEYVDSLNNNLDRANQIWVDHLNQQEKMQVGLLDILSTASHSLEQLESDRLNRQLERSRRYYDKQMEMAGNNTGARQRLEEDYQERQDELQKRAAERERRAFLFQQLAALAQVWIQTRLAIAKAIAISPVTFGEPMATNARIQGGISAGVILAQSIPAFAEGTTYVEGPGDGSKKDDRILSRLTRGERVMKVDENEAVGGKATSNKELVDAWKFYQAIPMQLRGDLWEVAGKSSGGTTIDYDLLADKIHKPITKEIRGQKRAVYIDGYRAAVADDQSHHKYVSKKLGIRL